ncbi:MAG: hypothetical protein CMH32_06195, partial [Micavibrio sp.]|nr:hypothetical protein [Micavibrio sp.]
RDHNVTDLNGNTTPTAWTTITPPTCEPIVTGVCGSADGTSMASAPSSGLCSSGSASSVSGSGPWTWTCSGEHGGGDASCSANMEVSCAYSFDYNQQLTDGQWNSQCGGPENIAGDSCTSGDPDVTVCGNTPYLRRFECRCDGTVVNPDGATLVNGQCGSADGTAVASKPTSNLCSKGSASSVSGSGPWSWTCNGSGSGSDASCSAPVAVTPVDGVCGSADGKTDQAIAPSGAAQCSAGTPSAVNTTTIPMFGKTHEWTCDGENGGSDATCSASFTMGGGGCEITSPRSGAPMILGYGSTRKFAVHSTYCPIITCECDGTVTYEYPSPCFMSDEITMGFCG